MLLSEGAVERHSVCQEGMCIWESVSREVVEEACLGREDEEAEGVEGSVS